MTEGITILLLSGSMMSMEGNVATKLIEAALDKGHPAYLFCFGEAVTALKSGQAPLRFPNLGKDLTSLTKRGLKIVACGTCGDARGLFIDDYIEGAQVGSLTTEFSEFLNESSRLVTIGR